MVQGVKISEDGYIINTNPATNEEISRIRTSTQSDIDETIQKANKAQIVWSATPLSQRITLLKKACHVFEQIKSKLSAKITEEMGKPIAEAEDEVKAMINKDAFLDLIEKANKDEKLGSSVVVRDALGVVALISPWNFPAGEIPLLALPALAAGNAVIVKPSEVAPECGAMVVETFASVLPPDTIQLLQGDGTVGSKIVQSNGVHMVAMTGSSATGRKIMENCAPGLKRLVLELGGKDPMVVFADADVDKAAKDAVTFSLFNTGQVCCAVERVYVEHSIQEKFEQKVVEAAKEWVVGDGKNRENKVGPMVSALQRDHVKAQVDDALDHGAKMLYQGSIPDASATTENGDEKGNYYPVTVLSGLKQDMCIQQAETFGPVVAIASFDGSEDEAVHLANDSDYGLAGYVYSTDLDKAGRVARKMRSGQVGINCYSLLEADIACPWVGHKSSGFGYHSGMEGFKQFSVPKSLVFPGN
mmetsp:Transcript_18084/g.24872  ORF Transcript_18084/g.24872 Transcript_18084/m.24872 type:complete len:473 (-) Transcript_18084:200-1618(-)